MPAGARYVGRPGPLGNPWAVTRTLPAVAAVDCYDRWLRSPQRVWPPAPGTGRMIRKRALEVIPTLTGADVACWCKLDAPCHGDIVLARANALPLAPWLITVGTMVALVEAETVTHAHLAAHDRWPGRAYTVRAPTGAELAAFREDQELTDQLRSARTVDDRRALLLTPRENAPAWHEPPLFA